MIQELQLEEHVYVLKFRHQNSAQWSVTHRQKWPTLCSCYIFGCGDVEVNRRNTVFIKQTILQDCTVTCTSAQHPAGWLHVAEKEKTPTWFNRRSFKDWRMRINLRHSYTEQRWRTVNTSPQTLISLIIQRFSLKDWHYSLHPLSVWLYIIIITVSQSNVEIWRMEEEKLYWLMYRPRSACSCQTNTEPTSIRCETETAPPHQTRGVKSAWTWCVYRVTVLRSAQAHQWNSPFLYTTASFVQDTYFIWNLDQPVKL